MKVVAASRLRRAQEALLNARPYHDTLERVADSLLLAAPEATAPAENAKRAILIVVGASDRGLCGGYNAKLLRLPEEPAREPQSRGLEGKFFPICRKGVTNVWGARRRPSVAPASNGPR